MEIIAAGRLLRILSFLSTLAAFLHLGQVHGQSEFILVGKSRVHSTRLLARYKDRARLKSSEASLQSVGVRLERQYQLVPGLVLLDVAEGQGTLGQMAVAVNTNGPAEQLLARIAALESSGLFDYVQPSYVYTNLLIPSDSWFTDGSLWGLCNLGNSGGVYGADIGAVPAWDITTGSSNVIVAVIDSGIRYTHRELASQMWRNPIEIPDNGIDEDVDGWLDDIFGLNQIAKSGDPFDDNSHGTHIAGTIGAAANDGNPHVGVAWKVALMACKSLDAEGFGTSDEAIACIDYAVRHGARIVNCSWGGARFERALFDSLTAARRRGVLIVAGAGNEASDNDSTPFYPASYPLDNIISVAAINRQDRLSAWSNFGRASVHLAAPGEDIFSCMATSDSAYGVASGTSMAAPHVSGVAALILARFPNASVHEVRERLLRTVVKTPNLAGKTRSGGRVNAYAALSASADGVLEVAFDPPEGSDLSARRPVPFFVTVTDLAGVTNATVRARIQGGSTDVQFQNNGTGPDVDARDEIYSAQLTIPSNPGPFDVRFDVTAPGKADFTQTVSYTVAVPPLNDNLADALEIAPEGGRLVWTNRFGTVEPGEPKHAQSPSVAASVWWNWKPARSSRVIIDTAGSEFDTVLAVYTNNTFAMFKQVAAADDAGTLKQGYVVFDAHSGVPYHIAVAGFSAPDAGLIRLRVEPGGGPDVTAPEVFITSPVNGVVLTNLNDSKLMLNGTAADPGPNSTGVRQVLVQLNHGVASAAHGATNWTSSVLLQEGQNQIKAVAVDFAGNVSRAQTIAASYLPVISPNDLLASAIALTGASGTVAGNNARASKEPGEPAHAGNVGGKSVWWSFCPPSDGLLSLSTENSSFNTLLAVYTGATNRISSLELLASNDDSLPGSGFSQVTQPVKGGQACFIAVDGFNASTGTVQLTYFLNPAPVCQLRIDAAVGGSTRPTLGFYMADSSVLLTATPDPFYWFDRWEGSISSTENPLLFRIRSDVELVPVFRPAEFSDDFETGDLRRLPWETSGSAPWIVETNVVDAGRFTARSGLISHGQHSSLLLKGVFRAGTGAFGLRVSSEPTWDVLDFLLNGIRLGRWSGEVGWTNWQFKVPAGTNTLEWRYSKDFQNSVGADAAFIDNLDLPLSTPIDSSTAARLSVLKSHTGTVQLTLLGQANQVYVIQTSSDLAIWRSVLTNVARGGTIRWPDPAGSDGIRFYRAVVP